MFYVICTILVILLSPWIVDSIEWILWKASDLCHSHKEKHQDEEN